MELPWAVNWSTVEPSGGKLVACGGDDPQTILFDRSSGKVDSLTPSQFVIVYSLTRHLPKRVPAYNPSPLPKWERISMMQVGLGEKP